MIKLFYKADFLWIEFYQRFADTLLNYADNRQLLIQKIQNVFKNCNMKLPTLGKDGIIDDINPFAVFGLFSKQITDDNRLSLIREFNREFEVNATMPDSYSQDEPHRYEPLLFRGIPFIPNVNALFCTFGNDSFTDDTDNLWQLFCYAIAYADSKSEESRQEFIKYFDIARQQTGISNKNLTMALFWMRPQKFLSLDSNSIDTLKDIFKDFDFSKTLTGKEYLELIERCRKTIPYSFPDISYRAKEKLPIIQHEIRCLHKKAKEAEDMTDIEKNTILYGPPGTGKTYSSVIYAVAIIENKPLSEIMEESKLYYKDVLDRYNTYKEQGLIAFTTFHQSMGYEEFIEGIRPVMNDASGELRYRVEPGIFKAFCENAENIGLNENPTVWKVSLYATGENLIRSACMEKNCIRIGYEHPDEKITQKFVNEMRIGDIVLTCYSNETIDAIGVVSGDYEWHEEYEEYRSERKVKWLAKGIIENIVDINSGKAMSQQTIYKLKISVDDVMAIVKKYNQRNINIDTDRKNRVFIIDEINRGNISKIFGELITLIEPSKRVGSDEAMRITLPYLREEFGVPDNVYIIGTMNTADRSIAAIDTALRRRFDFCEMLPDTETLEDCYVEDISIKELLDTMNKRISILYDREHTIGHAYFIPLLKDSSIDKLGEIFEKKIIPLLQEYFYEDYGKIRLVLGDNRKAEDAQFIIKNEDDYNELFGSDAEEFDEIETYSINADAFYNIEAYKI